jgi:predicted hydrocarbon binding protein
MPQEEVEAKDIGIPADSSGIPASKDTGIPAGSSGIPASKDTGIPADSSGIPASKDTGIPADSSEEEKPTTAKVRPSTKTIVASVRLGDESFDDTVRRIASSFTEIADHVADLESTNDNLHKTNTEIRETLKEEQERHETDYEVQVEEIGQLQARIKTLEDAAGTEVVPVGEQASLGSLGIKDMIEDVRDICGDDETCNKITGKMIDLKAHFTSKAVDLTHDAKQRGLDREQKELDRESKDKQAEKDRKFRQDQAERDNTHKIELALAKKGGFKKVFLEDVVFLGGGSPKQPKNVIEQKRKQAMAEAENDEEELYTPENVDSPENFDPEAEEELYTPENFDPEVEEELMVPGDFPEVE